MEIFHEKQGEWGADSQDHQTDRYKDRTGVWGLTQGQTSYQLVDTGIWLESRTTEMQFLDVFIRTDRSECFPKEKEVFFSRCHLSNVQLAVSPTCTAFVPPKGNLWLLSLSFGSHIRNPQPTNVSPVGFTHGSGPVWIHQHARITLLIFGPLLWWS